MTWLLSQKNGIALYPILEAFYGKGVLLDSTISHMETTFNYESILHDLIQNMNSKAIFTIKDMATESQWNKLKAFSIRYTEGAEVNESDEEEEGKEDRNPKYEMVRPFFKALQYSQFDICKILMLSPDEVKETVTKRELMMLN